MEKMLHGNNTRIPRAVLKQILKVKPNKTNTVYDHLPPISQTIQVDEQNILETAGEIKTNS